MTKPDYTDLLAKLKLLRGIPWACEAADAIEALLAESGASTAQRELKHLTLYEIEACLPSGTWRHSSLVGADEILRFAYAIEARVRGERQ